MNQSPESNTNVNELFIVFFIYIFLNKKYKITVTREEQCHYGGIILLKSMIRDTETLYAVHSTILHTFSPLLANSCKRRDFIG